ncbi:hypothetical protein HOF65_05955 [bacterium]|nr:hypothetical protein [bacterium]MBT4633281.1 hypothetical protein [bacterium]
MISYNSQFHVFLINSLFFHFPNFNHFNILPIGHIHSTQIANHHLYGSSNVFHMSHNSFTNCFINSANISGFNNDSNISTNSFIELSSNCSISSKLFTISQSNNHFTNFFISGFCSNSRFIHNFSYKLSCISFVFVSWSIQFSICLSNSKVSHQESKNSS